MDLQQFDRLTAEVLGPVMTGAEGFDLETGTFYRRLPDGLCQVVMVDFDVKRKSSFRVIVGFDATILHDPGAVPGQAGVVGSARESATLRAREKGTPAASR